MTKQTESTRLKVTVAKTDFVRVLERCQGVASPKTTMPILANVKLETIGQRLNVSATDLYLAVIGSAGADFEAPGSVCLPARDLLERVKFMPDGEITITTSDACVTTIRAKGSQRRYTLNGIPGEEFPSLPNSEGAKWITLPAFVLSNLFNRTAFAASVDDTRLNLNSVIFELEGTRARCVSSDGHRLALADESLSKPQSLVTMIPLKGVNELRRLLPDEGDVRIAVLGAHLFAEIGDYSFSVKLTDAQPVPYAQVIPTDCKRTVTAPRVALIEMIKAIQVASSDRTGGVRLTLTNGMLKIDSESPDGGQGFDEMAVDYSGNDLIIGANGKYLIEALAATQGDDVTIGTGDELDPILIQPVGNGGTQMVAMPLRI